LLYTHSDHTVLCGFFCLKKTNLLHRYNSLYLQEFSILRQPFTPKGSPEFAVIFSDSEILVSRLFKRSFDLINNFFTMLQV